MHASIQSTGRSTGPVDHRSILLRPGSGEESLRQGRGFVCDPTGWLLHHERDMRVDWRTDLLGLHQAGGIEAASFALTSLEADRLDVCHRSMHSRALTCTCTTACGIDITVGLDIEQDILPFLEPAPT